ncbi:MULTISPECIES: chromosomal replication initiator protein DnaA [unclassified Beijerinckia]|uniref:chromosomal replication initiator protein DnaA n=1 Tax=unclassified Beijerinckia TaxID=2638183 RepID=UPI00089D5C51|nr:MULTISPECIES: chromosomal replication initiator protein DnaA [unclassified Beijerinckia]MDH7797940.1 chromosomal replication initiator protein [Beijerinckia sp. GAS462]SED03508.1 chromosomal replication initiator protein DnaA [Beijerinckia sp. 28-YEA-48]
MTLNSQPASDHHALRQAGETPPRGETSVAWERVCQRLRSEVGKDIYNSWFARLEFERMNDTTLFCTVPTKFLKSWIQSHYLERLTFAVSAEFPGMTHVLVDVRSSARRPVLVGQPQNAIGLVGDSHNDVSPVRSSGAVAPTVRRIDTAPAEVEVNDAFAGAPLDKHLTFDSFIVGMPNQLAHAAAQKVSRSSRDEPTQFNPLYIYSSVGLGKTHLLQAIAHSASANGQKVIYLTAERFMYSFVAALRTQTAIQFKEKLRGIDTLVIDDVQFLRGKSIPQEFCHTLNALIDARRQVVIAADRPPSDLETIDERTRSRLAGGLCVQMRPFDENLRLKMVESLVATAKTAHPSFNVPESVFKYVANAIQTNGRDLDGAINRLIAHSTLAGAPLTVEMAESAIRDLVRTSEPKRVRIEDIQKLVANHYNVSKSDILSSRRTATVVRPRQIAMYLAKVLTLRSLPEIGRRFGGRDHTTVLHAVRKIEALSKSDNPLSEELELLKRMLTD